MENSYKIYDNSELGEVQINNEVIAVIAAMAAMEVDGVVSVAGGITTDNVSKAGAKKLSRAVKIDVADGCVMLDISIVLKMNESILNISKKVQDKIKTTIENMTGMEVANVNVNIANVTPNN
jgi:uncharacterized alkaline shock family protein YloU